MVGCGVVCVICGFWVIRLGFPVLVFESGWGG